MSSRGRGVAIVDSIGDGAVGELSNDSAGNNGEEVGILSTRRCSCKNSGSVEEEESQIEGPSSTRRDTYGMQEH